MDNIGDNKGENVILYRDAFLNNGNKKAPTLLENFYFVSFLFESYLHITSL